MRFEISEPAGDKEVEITASDQNPRWRMQTGGTDNTVRVRVRVRVRGLGLGLGLGGVPRRDIENFDVFSMVLVRENDYPDPIFGNFSSFLKLTYFWGFKFLACLTVQNFLRFVVDYRRVNEIRRASCRKCNLHRFRLKCLDS
jgi:hypothetical protein